MDRDHPLDESLDAEQLAALKATPLPGSEVEERVVMALRERGILGAPKPAHALHRHPSRLRRIHPAWISGIAAAAAFAIGLRMGEQRARVGIAEQRPTMVVDSSAVAASVRSTGLEYITALAAVPAEHPGGRDAALGTFRTAADQIMRLAPESDLAFAIGLAFPKSFAVSPAVLAEGAPVKRIIWF